MVTINSIDSGIPIELSKGGTNATSMATNTGILKYDGTRLITSTTALIDASNRYTNTSQPAFLAYVNTTLSNVTGDGTVYTIIYDTEVYDQGNNFDIAAGVFTAPITGKYHFSFSCVLASGDSALTDARALITSTAKTYDFLGMAVTGFATVASQCSNSITLNMTAGDTVSTQVAAGDSGGKVVSIQGNQAGRIRCFLSGELVT